MENLEDLFEIEKERLDIVDRLIKVRNTVIIIAVLVFIVIFIKSGFSFSGNIFFTTISITIISISLFFAYKAYSTKIYNHNFKNITLRKVLADIDPSLKYYPYNYIDFKDFNNPRMYIRPDIYKGNDLVYGKYKGVNIKFSDLNLIEKVEIIDEKGHRKTSYRNIFKGICFIANFNKHFTSETYIRSSRNAKTYGKRAYMDDTEFEREFNVYTNDQVNARYIITPLFMERLLLIKKLFNAPINMAFIDNKIYIYIEFNKDSFEPDINATLIGENSLIKKYQVDIINLLNLVDELNLNRDIFSVIKER
ncbi:DUF3137 domain-containing protein [Campylobacter blaseri]|uniref:Galanin n=1 Tax=Campylobacter blaseri TaxID=2042961 RepID=A0A2P8R3G0_9BACT|nr:DUF3137 domain-containing protein [Campylobacter blaseri]PSM53031.1 hypothetical protein CQ405_00305 [Campylobacter blaseri]PSM54498.1 hypothetical protein CRN67_00305 [Campylobacter blaseri]QKF85254.1 DUF3137 domain-containing protein [Campylobacter blaseri]